MKKILISVSLMSAILLFPALALSQDLMVFPAQGQTEEQTERDKFDCYNWAKKESGFDPMQVPQASTPAPSNEVQRGGAVKGAAKGAAVGAVGGAIADDTRKGAQVGAATGAIVGGARQNRSNRQQAQQREQWEQQEAAKYNEQRSRYNRAYAACLEAKGYSVK